MKLYHMPPTRSDRARWALEEIGAPYDAELVDLRAGAQNEPAFRAIHPLGVVPALEDEGSVFRESTAIVMHLADRFPDAKLAPPVGSPARGRYYELCTFAPAELDHFLVIVTQNTMLLAEERRDAAAAEAAKERLKPRLEWIAREAGDSFLMGEFSAADIAVGHSVVWSSWFGMAQEIAALGAYLGRLGERAAFQRVYQK